MESPRLGVQAANQENMLSICGDHFVFIHFLGALLKRMTNQNIYCPVHTESHWKQDSADNQENKRELKMIGLFRADQDGRPFQRPASGPHIGALKLPADPVLDD
ncbi:hypothetical protein X801_03314 [Opisthorchis viverrini]|uniref:Uncharacterized protein n=2 Tax=Opisthorchis viverrini TaxID=6198 RepID=A0A074ZH32_OPIVI|nr:hypothetical protein T265_06237 [Opisthorchis viverrini]KER26518.1 hypothetical protein T265_06237 [Opisthorchis viverrini]OON20799.1 hypothetical protein X801_03314 [Opisthorchis viverrini]